MKNKKIKKINNSMSDKTFNVILTIIATVWLLIVLYPLIFIVSSSFSSGTAVSSGKVLLWPVDFSLAGYELVLKYKLIWTGYANTLLYAGLGTLVHLVCTICGAYPLSRRNYQAKNLVQKFLTVSMLFGGGLIPTYIVVSRLGLNNTRTYMIISGAVSISHMIIMRTFFQSNIPHELLESAKMDGISDFGYLLKIVIPLSKASISVIMLYSLVGKWNAYFGPMIYLTKDRNMWPLQLVVRQILQNSQMSGQEAADADMEKMAAVFDQMKYSTIIISTLPMLILYPCLQKFFEKGVMVGSLKG